MSLTGKWINSYGSLMTLFQSQQGSVIGEYVSTTGSSGKYCVRGWAGSMGPSAQAGQPAALSIYWRSITGGQGDPSWHWVSGLAGQLLPSQGSSKPTLSLMHAMVVTEEFPAVANIGTYIDKLTYTLRANPPSSAELQRLSSLRRDDPFMSAQDLTNLKVNPVVGRWVCDRNGAELTLQFDPHLPYPGAINGGLALRSSAGNPVSGFTDIYAQQRDLSLRAVAATSLDLKSGNCVSLAGSLDTVSNLMTLSVYTANATAPDASYMQATVDVWTFRKPK